MTMEPLNSLFVIQSLELGTHRYSVSADTFRYREGKKWYRNISNSQTRMHAHRNFSWSLPSCCLAVGHTTV